MKEAMDEVQMVVEGVYSAKAGCALGKKYQVPMPIIEQVNQVLFEGKAAQDAVCLLYTSDPAIPTDKAVISIILAESFTVIC